MIEVDAALRESEIVIDPDRYAALEAHFDTGIGCQGGQRDAYADHGTLDADLNTYHTTRMQCFGINHASDPLKLVEIVGRDAVPPDILTSLGLKSSRRVCIC